MTITTTTITLSQDKLKLDETATVTIAFAGAVTGLDIDDFTVADGHLSGLASADGGVTWTAILTPDYGKEGTDQVISLATEGVLDQDGHAGVGTVLSPAYSFDTKSPIMSVALSDDDLRAGETATVTVHFDEVVTGFSNANITLPNGTLSTMSSDDGKTWTGTFTPLADFDSNGNPETSNRINFQNLGDITDAAGNALGNTPTGYYKIDTQSPTATIALSDHDLAAGEVAHVTLSFSEAVTGVSSDSLTATHGTLSDLTTADGGITWTGTLTAPDREESTGNVLTLNYTNILDLQGHQGRESTSSAAYSIDTRAPEMLSATLGDVTILAGETRTLTITFSEAVTGLDSSDLAHVGNGSVGELSSADGGITWTGTFTPDSGVTATENTISLDLAGVTDLAGNAGVGQHDSASYAIDTARPTATIKLSDSNLLTGETAVVTIAFSEKVTDLTVDDLAVANGELSALASSDGGKTWTATFTPTKNIADSSNTITLDTADITDVAGNHGAGVVSSANYAVHTTPVVAPSQPAQPVVSVLEVDGVEISKQLISGSDGTQTQIITIPVVTDTRPDSGGEANLANIALVSDAQGHALLDLGVPMGISITASGATGPAGAQQSLSSLVTAIEAHTQSGSVDQHAMVAGGTAFLDSLGSTAPLLVHTIVATAPADAEASDTPLVIRGVPAADGTPQTALVIDATALPDGSVIELQDVGFVVVLGNVHLTGGAGAQTVWGDSAAQNILLGADDDILHGGGGNDIIGSAGGNDQIFGDDGDDIVFGGLGNDIIDGGTGHDIVQLVGTSRADYHFEVADGKLVMTHRDGGADGTDTVSNVEVLRFTGAAAPVDVDFNTTDVASLVRLYHTAFDRAADAGGLNLCIDSSEHGVALNDIATAMLQSAEAQHVYGGLDNSAYIAALYADGLGRSGSAAEVQGWASLLDSGIISRGEALLDFADSAEKIALVGAITTSIDTI